MVGLQTVAVAFSMFSRIPMPQFAWDSRNMRYALCAFPLIGAVIWGAVALWLYLCELLALPDLLRAAVATVIPVWITGGIHLDGYADTQDALASFSSPEKRQEILKDPHLGAFAAIRLCCYFLLTLGRPGPSCLVDGTWLSAQPQPFRAGRSGVSPGKQHGTCPHLFHCRPPWASQAMFGHSESAAGCAPLPGRPVRYRHDGSGNSGVYILLSHGKSQIWRSIWGPGRLVFADL